MKSFAVFVFLFFTSSGLAQNPDPAIRAYPESPEFRDIAKQLRCPTCTGLSVLESDAQFSVQIKDLVAEQVQQGKSKEEVLSFFVERYGPWILREPPKTGFNMIAWVLPIGLLLLGPLLVWILVWRRRKPAEAFGLRSSEEIAVEFESVVSARRNQLRGGL